MNDLLRELRFAARSLRKSPGFTALAVLTLVLGIGANVAIFTILDTVLLRPPPYFDPGRLVEIDDIYQGRRSGVGQDEFREWVAKASLFEGLALVEADEVILRAAGHIDAERIVGNRVSDGFFSVLGAKPLYGRSFLAGEDLPGRANVIVLSHALWRRRFGSDPHVIGTTVTLGETPYTVVGVMPSSFYWMQSKRAEYWRPLGYRSSGRRQHQYDALARLRPGVSLAAAQAQMDVLARSAEERYAAAKGWRIRVLPLGHAASAEARTPLLALTSAVALVLLIACANLASLMTVRSVSRAKEIAVRTALGATRGRLLRQFLVESALLASIGGALGVLLANWMLRTLVVLLTPGISLPPLLALDVRALGFAVVVTALTTMLFGLLPIRRTIRLDLMRIFKASGGGTTIGTTQRRFLDNLVVGEVALATVLLIAASLLVTSLAALFSRDLGFRPEQVLTFEVQLPVTRYDRARQVAFFQNVIERLNSLPGIEEAAATDSLPMSGIYSGTDFQIEGSQAPAEWRQQSAQSSFVTPGYFRTMGIGLLRGRAFAASERAPVVVISETLARRHWPNEDPVGRRIRYGGGADWFTVVGVASDTRYGGPTHEPNPTIYLPDALTTRLPGPSWMFVVVRLGPIADPVLPAIRAVVRQLDPLIAVTRVATMDDLSGRSVAVERSLATLLTTFAVFAVALAAIGLYGVIAYSVQQRTREIGVRLALGAEATQVRNMVLWQGGRAALLGIAIGTTLAFGLTHFISSYLFAVTARDPLIFSIAPVLLMAVALIGVWLPARRAAHIDPAITLRAE